jgi:peptide/nickel transport system permease protein
LTRALADAVASIPAIIGLLALGLVLGGGFAIVPLTIALVQWPAIFRAVRAEARRLRDATFTRASEAMGASPWWILRHHIIPHLAPLLAASFATSFAWAVQAEAVLGFLGLSPSDWPSLGRLMGEGASELARGFVWPVAFAGGTLFVAVASAQVLADEFARED